MAVVMEASLSARAVERKTQSEDRRLLARLRHGDAAALAELNARFGTPLTRAAFLYLGDAHAAADMVQDALVAAWDGCRRTAETTALRPWLFGILFNRCRKELRSRRRRRRREVAAFELRESLRQDPSEWERETDRLDSLRRALDRLEPGFREVVILRYHQDMSVEEVSRTLGIPAGTVKSRTHAACAKLKREMERWNASP